ncbi:hypothetical protein [Neisseria dumasiana]|uniref:hypothetical protein n=1 Tax=Neisseria dumasiana TaxID=1931275 RepID=UPI000F791008|nr:hypothetical protein [Neisseria dumasiana]
MALRKMNIKEYWRLCICLPSIMFVAACAYPQNKPDQKHPVSAEQTNAHIQSQFDKPHENLDLETSYGKKSRGMKKMAKQADHVTAEGEVKKADNPPAPIINPDKAKAASREFKIQAEVNPPYKGLDELSEEEHDKILKKSLPLIGQYGNVDSTGLGHYPRRQGEQYQSDKPIIYYIDE